MFRTRRLPLMIVLILTLAPAGAGRVDAKPLGGDVARLAWHWLTATLSGSSLLAWAPAGEALTCGLGPATDPNGQCVPARTQRTSTCDHGLSIDPDGRCMPMRIPAQDTLTCGHGASIDPNGQCVQSPGGLPR